MSKTNVETITSTADRLKLGLAVLVIIGGAVAYAMLENEPLLVRVGAFICCLVLAAIIAWFSEPGRRTISFGRDSYNEVKRVVWPTRKETTQMTGIVFAFVAAMALLLWVADKGIGWVVYSLVLGWK